MKKISNKSVHLRALETRLVRLQMLERECAYLQHLPGRRAMRKKRMELNERIHKYLRWMFASKLIGSADYGRLASLFHKATEQSWWGSNATMYGDDHPLIRELRITWRWAQFKLLLRVSAPRQRCRYG